ncbi:Uncharacterized protein TCM_006553 [Theobroma cacao]|uniref:Uncharacterized protein n=1 Tax=Theobroma cacao TaxID=3641 RepID=A0A061DYS4_THECC|nr:Uncharacterized protein TCM_006553 [Theobroma cacao]
MWRGMFTHLSSENLYELDLSRISSRFSVANFCRSKRSKIQRGAAMVSNMGWHKSNNCTLFWVGILSVSRKAIWLMRNKTVFKDNVWDVDQVFDNSRLRVATWAQALWPTENESAFRFLNSMLWSSSRGIERSGYWRCVKERE